MPRVAFNSNFKGLAGFRAEGQRLNVMQAVKVLNIGTFVKHSGWFAIYKQQTLGKPGIGAQKQFFTSELIAYRIITAEPCVTKISAPFIAGICPFPAALRHFRIKTGTRFGCVFYRRQFGYFAYRLRYLFI